jgi:hypothetical protein
MPVAASSKRHFIHGLLVFLNSLIVGFVVQLSIRWVRKLCGCSDHRV